MSADIEFPAPGATNEEWERFLASFSDREWALYFSRCAEARGNPTLAARWKLAAADFTVPNFSQPEL